MPLESTDAETATATAIRRLVPETSSGPLLSGGGSDWDRHRGLYGDVPSLDAEALIGLTRAAGIVGRGGAEFPTWRKLNALKDAGRHPVVIANGSEGEPASSKDAMLMHLSPQLILDGVMAIAIAFGAREIVCVAAPAGIHSLRDAAMRRPDGRRIRFVTSGSRFISGEAGAVTNRVTGGPGLPPDRLRPLTSGDARGRPTLVDNVETLADIALALRLGPDAYRALGRRGEPGTRLFTLSGDVADTGVLEAPAGSTLAEIAAPCFPAGGSPRVNALVGGYSGGWLGPDEWDIPLTRSGLSEHGFGPGPGIVEFLSPGRCPLRRVSHIVDMLAEETSGRCGPCAFGLPALARAFADLALQQTGVHGDARRIDQLAGHIVGRGACAHPDGAVALIRHTISGFHNHVRVHEERRCGLQ